MAEGKKESAKTDHFSRACGCGLKPHRYTSKARKYLAIQDCQTLNNLNSLLKRKTLSEAFTGRKGLQRDLEETIGTLRDLSHSSKEWGATQDLERIKADLIMLKKRAFAWVSCSNCI